MYECFSSFSGWIIFYFMNGASFVLDISIDHQFHKYLPNSCYMAGTVLSSMVWTKQALCPQDARVLNKGTKRKCFHSIVLMKTALPIFKWSDLLSRAICPQWTRGSVWGDFQLPACWRWGGGPHRNPVDVQDAAGHPPVHGRACLPWDKLINRPKCQQCEGWKAWLNFEMVNP